MGLLKMTQSAASVVYSRLSPWDQKIIDINNPELTTSRTPTLSSEIEILTHRIGNRSVLFVCVVGMFLVYMDRGVVDGMAGSFSSMYNISIQWFVVMQIMFTIFYAVCSPLFGYICRTKRVPETAIVTIGMFIFLYSAIVTTIAGVSEERATVLSQVVLGRIISAVANAAYIPVSMSLIYNIATTREIAFFVGSVQIAIVCGASTGYILAGLLYWVYIFAMEAVISGIIAGLLVGVCNASINDGLRGVVLAILKPARQPPQFVSAQMEMMQERNSLKTKLERLQKRVLNLWSNKKYVNCVVANAFTTFVLSGMAFWAPYYYHVQFDLQWNDASVFIGVMSGVAGSVGTVGGMLGSWYTGPEETLNFATVLGVCVLIGCIGLACTTTHMLMYTAMLLLVELFMFAQNTPFTETLCASVNKSERALALSVNTMVIHLFGEFISPLLFGMAIRHFTKYSMIVPALCIAGSIVFLLRANSIDLYFISKLLYWRSWSTHRSYSVTCSLA